MKQNTWTGLVCPKQWVQSMACKFACGFQLLFADEQVRRNRETFATLTRKKHMAKAREKGLFPLLGPPSPLFFL
jgi:hypothetical protein